MTPPRAYDIPSADLALWWSRVMRKHPVCSRQGEGRCALGLWEDPDGVVACSQHISRDGRAWRILREERA